MTLSELTPLLPELFLCVSAMALLIMGVFAGNKSTVDVAMMSAIVLVVTFGLTLFNAPEGNLTFGFMYVSNGFTHLAKQLILIGGVMALIHARGWLAQPENQRFEYGILILFAVLGLMLMVSANDFLGLYMGLELSSLSLYVLAAISRDDEKSSEAGLKYFVLGAIASGFLLFGTSLIYGFAGTTQFDALASLFLQNPISSEYGFQYGLIVGLVLVLVAFAFKISAAPFHMWTPDVYEGAPTAVIAFFATAPKVAGLFLIARVLMGPFFELHLYWEQIIWIVAAMSMAVGAFGALTQTNIKRLLAYSSIGHVGYALVGLVSGTFVGVQGVVIYVMIYLFMAAGAFGCVLMMRRKGRYMEQIDDLAGISSKHPFMAASIGVLMFSMAGIPPLAGFFGKFYVLSAAIGSGYYVLATFGLLMSVVACFYYLKVVKVMYFDEPDEEFDTGTHGLMKLSIALSVLVSVCFALKPALFLAPAEAAVRALM